MSDTWRVRVDGQEFTLPSEQHVLGIQSLAESIQEMVINSPISAMVELVDGILGVRRQVDTGPLTKNDIENIRSIVTGGNPRAFGDKLSVGQIPMQKGGCKYSLTTRHGGYVLLFPPGAGDAVIINLDIGAMITDERLHEYRSIILAIAEEVGAQVIPAGQTAFFYGPTAQGMVKSSLALVDRRDFESVFTMRNSHGKTRWYLSGYDTQETPALYFICRLPHEVASVEEAYEALMPNSVKIALKEGKRVVRQGDLFAIETDMDDKQLKKAGATIHKAKLSNVAGVSLYGTAHTCTRVASFPNGIMAGTGTIIHNPEILDEDRPADHSDRELSDNWWFIMKNTVPISGTAMARQRQRW